MSTSCGAMQWSPTRCRVHSDVLPACACVLETVTMPCKALVWFELVITLAINSLPAPADADTAARTLTVNVLCLTFLLCVGTDVCGLRAACALLDDCQNRGRNGQPLPCLRQQDLSGHGFHLAACLVHTARGSAVACRCPPALQASRGTFAPSPSLT